jgi:hypothetical protein
MCTHDLGGQSVYNGYGRTSAADAEIGAATVVAGGPTAQSVVRPCASAHACKSAVACKGNDLETYVGRAGCLAFLPGSSLCWGCAVRSSGRSCSGRFRVHQCGGGRTGVRQAAETARWRRVGTRVDWSCNRRCCGGGVCTHGLPSRGGYQRCFCTALLVQFRLSSAKQVL